MNRLRLVLVAGMALLPLALSAAPASAKPSKLALAYTPAAPNSTDTIVVTFTAGRLAPGERYTVSAGGGLGASGVECTAPYVVKLPRQRPGRKVRVRLTPSGRNASGRPFSPVVPSLFHSQFCAGAGGAEVAASDPDGRYRLLARRPMTITAAPDYPKPSDMPGWVGLLDGSSVTVRATGRPDRTFGLKGELSGPIPGPVVLNSDITLPTLGGSVVLRNLAPDPLCAGARYLTVLGTADRATPTSLLMRKSGEATMTLVLAHPPTVLAGCADVSAVPATTAITLNGRVGTGGLTNLQLSGTLGGVTLAPGVTAELSMTLVLNVSLGGPPPA